jgi:hypothetical protein
MRATVSSAKIAPPRQNGEMLDVFDVVLLTGVTVAPRV